MSSPKLSLTMIVRNEAQLLPRFISCIQGLADEWVVVDTGSSDETVELLRQAGAHVLHFPWENDFSKARNWGLKHCTGDWVLFLDADEFVSPTFAAQAHALMADARIGAASVRMQNPLPHGHVRDTYLLRMFRRDDALTFRYPIHEDISESVSDMLRRQKLQHAFISAPIEHVGYVRDHALTRGKKERDRQLLQQCLALNPLDFYSHFKHLEQARFWEDTFDLRQAAVEALKALNVAGKSALKNAPFGGELLVLIASTLKPSPKDALEFLKNWETSIPPSAAFFLRLGELYEQIQHFEEAEAAFVACTKKAQHFGNCQLSHVRPWMGLARLAMAKGQWTSAREWVEKALEVNSRDPEALLAGVALARAQGGNHELHQWATRQLERFGATSELYEALGEEAFQRRQWNDAKKHFEIATKLGPSSAVEIRLAQLDLYQGDLESAYQRVSAIQESNTDAAIGQLVLNLILERDSDVTLSCGPEAASASLRNWALAATQSLNPLLQQRFLQFSPSLFEAFPWLASFVNQFTTHSSSTSA